jgi:hypothetical protein
MSKRDFKETKEEFLKKLQEETTEVRKKVSGYSHKERANLLKLAREVIKKSQQKIG